MTKELELAIEMWQEIVNKCKAGDNFCVVTFKMKFCKKHKLNWLYDCYFCQYCKSCCRCPLDDKCGQVYSKVVVNHDVASAEKILNALKGIKKG